MFTQGRIIFTAIFALIFVVGLILAYRKEAKLNLTHYAKPYKILISIVLILGLLYLIVNIKKFI